MSKRRTIPESILDAPRATRTYLVEHRGFNRHDRRRKGGKNWRAWPVTNVPYRKPKQEEGNQQ